MKFIIEVAALTNKEIIVLSQLIKRVIIADFGIENFDKIFVKSSTGFFKIEEGKPNGATFKTMQLII